MSKPVELPDLLTDAMDTRLEEVHVCLPGKVVKYDASKQVADVQIMVKHKGFDYEEGTPLYTDFPVLPSVPVLWPSGGGFSVTLPLEEGDYVFLLFAETSISEWRASGQVSTPTDAARHTLSNAVAIPGAKISSNPIANASSSNLIIGHESSDGVIEISSGEVKLGKNATDFVALSQKVDTAITTIVNAFNTHVHATAAVGPPVVPTTLIAPVPLSTAATKVKAI